MRVDKKQLISALESIIAATCRGQWTDVPVRMTSNDFADHVLVSCNTWDISITAIVRTVGGSRRFDKVAARAKALLRAAERCTGDIVCIVTVPETVTVESTPDRTGSLVRPTKKKGAHK